MKTSQKWKLTNDLLGIKKFFDLVEPDKIKKYQIIGECDLVIHMLVSGKSIKNVKNYLNNMNKNNNYNKFAYDFFEKYINNKLIDMNFSNVNANGNISDQQLIEIYQNEGIQMLNNSLDNISKRNKIINDIKDEI